MAQRREVPPITRSGGTIDVRLPDGRTMSVPVSQRGPVTGDTCCFCGEAVVEGEPDRIWLTARWSNDGEDQEQSWEAHRRCLLDRLHERVIEQGPLFGR